MPVNRTTNSTRGRTVCGMVCLLLFISFQLFAAVPKLHNWLHSDSDDPAHHCSLTLLTQGQVNTTVNEEKIAAPVRLAFVTLTAPEAAAIPTVHRQLPPGRAPPAI